MSFNQPTDDPLPWVTDRMRRAGVFQTDIEREQHGDWYQTIDPDTGAPLWKRPTVEKRRMTGAAASALLDVLTQAVSALHDDEKAYTVVLSASTATAGTLLEKRVVQVGSKPMNDDDLTEGQKAAVMAGLALHEVGHIRYARQYSAAITRLFGAGNVTGAISTLSNLAADLHDEAEACRVFPGLAPSVAVTLWWVGNKGRIDGGMTIDQAISHSAIARVNAAIATTRYPWTCEWDTQAAVEWRAWWDEWAGRAAQADKPKDHALIVQEAIEKIRERGIEEPEPPEGPGPTCGPSGPQQPPQPGQDRSDKKPQPGQGQGQGQDEPTDEKGDEPGSGKGDEKGDDEPKGDEPKPGSGTGDGDGEKPIDGKGDEKGDEPGDKPADDGDEAKPVDGGDGTTNPGGQGSTDGDGSPYDPNENNTRDLKDACVKPAANGGYEDEKLQRGADKITRGKREGMRRRHYNHASSVHGEYSGGRTVVSIPRKGKRFVWDV